MKARTFYCLARNEIFKQHGLGIRCGHLWTVCVREVTDWLQYSCIIQEGQGERGEKSAWHCTKNVLPQAIFSANFSHLFLFCVIVFNPLKPELNSICYLLALLGAHHFLHVSRIRVKLLTFRLLLSYIYGATILDVSRSHTTTQHSR